MFIRLNRIGKHGKMIKVLKMRTMHPYSEYLQDYVFDKNKLEEGGKFANDFRVTTLGRFMRRFWLDEFPMFYNLLKGDIKLVGVRPLSPQYFSLYTRELQQHRIRFKPGMIPPYYADLPKTFEEIMESEKKYLDAYERRPIRTDIRYFFKATYNILFKKVRSK
jgi:lipopolysaccharide/colanic/teichoic acid biosynthesis glycosyltransferase